MGLKEIAERAVQSFFIILSGSLISMYVFRLLFYTDDIILMSEIAALIILSFITALTFFVFYSNNELSGRQMLTRHILQGLSVLTIVLLIANHMEWVRFGEPVKVAIFVILVTAVYILVIAFSLYQTQKLAEQLNQKLKERYKG